MAIIFPVLVFPDVQEAEKTNISFQQEKNNTKLQESSSLMALELNLLWLCKLLKMPALKTGQAFQVTISVSTC